MVTASDGEEAVRSFDERVKEVDVVIMDLVLPKLSGLDLLERLRHRRPDVPVILMSGYSPEHARIEELVREGVKVLHKPFSRTELAVKVRETLDRAQNKPS